MNFFDIHSHLHDEAFESDRDEVIKRMRIAGVKTITVGTHLESSRGAIALASKEPDVWATVGLHPTDTDESWNEREYGLLAEHKKVVAIGECGLDYFRQNDIQKRKIQKNKFIKQIELSLNVGKPLMIHSRPSEGTVDAYEDILDILKNDFASYKEKIRGNVHFFVGDENAATQFMELGFTLSFTGVITFTKAYDEIIKFLPLEYILSETDCPYVTPAPYRGQRNEPPFVPLVVDALARIKEIPAEKIAEALNTNVNRIFGIK